MHHVQALLATPSFKEGLNMRAVEMGRVDMAKFEAKATDWSLVYAGRDVGEQPTELRACDVTTASLATPCARVATQTRDATLHVVLTPAVEYVSAGRSTTP